MPELSASGDCDGWGTIMEATNLPLIKWFQAFYLVGEVKTGISSLSLMRMLGVNYPTAWLVHNKIMQAMSERERMLTCCVGEFR
jgi:hypothetical protein